MALPSLNLSLKPKLEMISFVNNGAFDDTSFPDGVFDDLVSLKFFDFFGNNIATVKKSLFESGWGENLLCVALCNNQITEVEDGIFDTLTSLEQVYMHGNQLENFDALDGLSVVQLTV